MESVAEASSPPWLTSDDQRFLREVCIDLTSLAAGKELSQSSVLRINRGDKSPLFGKKSSVALLQAKSPRNPEAKWRVTQASFVNEHLFLKSEKIADMLRHRSACIPAVYALYQTGPDEDFNSVFWTLLEFIDLEKDYLEKPTIDYGKQSQRVVRWLAAFHASFWGRSQLGLRQSFLEFGGWWRKPLRPTVKWMNLVPTFQHLSAQFPDEFSKLQSSGTLDKLTLISDWAQSNAFLKATGPSRTMIHGDVKTCNMFLSRHDDSVMAIDFQWTGNAASGLGDVVYFFYGGVTSFPPDKSESETLEEFLSRMRFTEGAILDFYFSELSLELGEGESFTEEECHRQYDLELLDYFSTAVPYLLSDLTPKLIRKNLKKYGYLTYEFDPRMTAFFFFRALEALRAQESFIRGVMGL